MEWKYAYPSPEATHLPSGMVFVVRYSSTNADVIIKPQSQRPYPVSEANIQSLISELDLLITDEQLRSKMSRILHQDFRRDFSRAALVLEKETKRRVSTRTLQAWLMSRDKASSRRCPEWAVKALEDYMASNKEEFSLLQEAAEGRAASEAELDHPGQRLGNLSRDAVEQAERRIAMENHLIGKWASVPASKLPRKIADLEIEHIDRYTESILVLDQLRHTLKESSDFDEFRSSFLKVWDSISRQRLVVRQTADDIRLKRGEFGSDDGTLA